MTALRHRLSQRTARKRGHKAGGVTVGLRTAPYVDAQQKASKGETEATGATGSIGDPMDTTAWFGVVWLCVNLPLFVAIVLLLVQNRSKHPLSVQNAQVLCALLVLFFGLGGWLALSRTVNEYIPCRVSSMFFFPAYVLLLAVVKHRQWLLYRKHYDADWYLTYAMERRAWSECTLENFRSTCVDATMPKKMRYADFFFRKGSYIIAFLEIVLCGVVMALSHWDELMGWKLIDPQCKELTDDAVQYLYFIPIVDTCLALALFGYLFRPYNDTVGLSNQSHWMCGTFFLAMFLWAIFALVATSINEEYEVTVMIVCLVCTVGMVIYGAWPLALVFRYERQRQALLSSGFANSSASSLLQVLSDRSEREEFVRFLRLEFALENLMLFDAVQSYKEYIGRILMSHELTPAVRAEAEHLALSLYLTFLDPDANLQVNVPATILRSIQAVLDPGSRPIDKPHTSLGPAATKDKFDGTIAMPLTYMTVDVGNVDSEADITADTDAINLDTRHRMSEDRSDMPMERLTADAIANRLRELAHMYDEAQKCVLATMATDSFKRFRRATRSG